jgi:heptosyltransferase-2
MTERILILGPSWVGDMVLAHSLYRVLKDRQTDSYISVAAPSWTAPLLERMPEVDEIIPLPFRHGQLALGERFRLGRKLRKERYDQAILLVNSFKSAILPFAAGIPKRTGFLGESRYGLLNDIRPLDKSRLPRTVDRFVSLGLARDELLPDELPSPSLLANREQALQVLQRLGISMPDRPILGLCPGAEYGAAKRWPAEYYADVAKQAAEQGWGVWLFGSQKDIPVTSEVNELSGGLCLDLGGRTMLAEVIDLMSLTSAVVSNDSGLMHVAAALDKRLVAIYGSSDPNHTPPMSDKASVLYLAQECSPCFKRECPLGHMKCLYGITPQRVISELEIRPSRRFLRLINTVENT